ncbi:MAG TPA: hypothetical protein VGL60_08430 [Acidimicrobiales bacterium]
MARPEADPGPAAYRRATDEAVEVLAHLTGARDALRASLAELPPVWNTLAALEQVDPRQIESCGLADRLREIRDVVEEFRGEVAWLEGLVAEWPEDFGVV